MDIPFRIGAAALINKMDTPFRIGAAALINKMDRHSLGKNGHPMDIGSVE
jgi:hypothetical protein